MHSSYASSVGDHCVVLQCSGGAIYAFAWSFALFVGESLSINVSAIFY